MQTTPHVQTQKENAAAIAKKVIELLNWKEDQYTFFKFRRGLRYLFIYFGDDYGAVEYQEKRKAFWNWWKNQWYLRDLAFVDNYDPELPLQFHVISYHAINNPATLACEIYPDSLLLGAGFAKHSDIIEFLKSELY